MFPNNSVLDNLAVSSGTIAIIEACLNRRSVETRVLTRHPSLFGWEDAKTSNDTELDPPKVSDIQEVLELISLFYR